MIHGTDSPMVEAAAEGLKTAFNPWRWVVALSCVAAVIGAFLWYRHSLIQEGVDREKSKVAEAVAEQKAIADEQVRSWKEHANEIDARNQELQAELKKLSGSNKSRASGLQQSAPSADRMAGASAETCGRNAAEAESDLGECAVRYSALGDTAAGAAEKAWELHDKWPAYQEFQDRMTTFTDKLKGK